MTTLANLTTYFAGESASLLSAIETTKGGLRSLLKELDPVAAATDRVNKQQAMLDNALKRGQISLETHTTSVATLRSNYERYLANQKTVATATGQMRAGMQQLSFQLGDVATQFAAGTAPMIIFAQQGGQVLQAVSLMQKEAKGFIGFLAGPWGQVIMASALIVSTLASKLFETGDAAKAAEDATKDLNNRVAEMGTFFDKATGKIKETNQTLIEYALLRAKVRQDEQRAIQDQARKTGREAMARSARQKFTTSGVYSGDVGGEVTFRDGSKQITDLFKNGPMAPGIDAELRKIASGSGPNASYAATILQSRAEYFSAQAKINKDDSFVADLRRGYTTDPDFVNQRKTRTKRQPRDRTDENQARYEDQLGKMQAEELTLYAELTGSIGARYEAQMAALKEDRAAFDRDLALDKTKSAQKKIALREQRDQIDSLKEQKISNEQQEAEAREYYALTHARSEAMQALLEADLESADNAKDRLDAELRILELQKRDEAARLKLVLATEKTGSEAYNQAQKGLETLDQRYRDMATRSRRQNETPAQAFMRELNRSAGAVNEDFERISVDGLKSLNDGLADAILGAKSLGEVFSNVADQIVSSLLRIALQENLIKPLGKQLFGDGSDGAGGGVPSWLSSIFGGGSDGFSTAGGLRSSGASLGNLAHLAGGGSFMVGQNPGIDRNLLSINGKPMAMVSADERIHVTPANDRSGVQALQIYVAAEEGALFRPVVRAEANGAAIAATAGAARATAKRASRQLD